MEIVQKSAFKVVGIPVIATWDELWTEVPAAWEEVLSRQAEIRNRINALFLDISLNKEGDLYTQLVCAEVSQFEHIPPGMIVWEIPDQRYLHHRHEGTLKEIAGSFGQMYQWAAENNTSVDDFKVDCGYTFAGHEREHDLYVRVSG